MKRLSILSLTIFESYEKITQGLWEWQIRSLIMGDDKVFFFEDCIVTSMPDKDTSDGGVSWSSGSFQEPISDPVVLVSCCGSSNFLSRGIDSCAWESGTDPHICAMLVSL
jgi:hypothetical protein